MADRLPPQPLRELGSQLSASRRAQSVLAGENARLRAALDAVRATIREHAGMHLLEKDDLIADLYRDLNQAGQP